MKKTILYILMVNMAFGRLTAQQLPPADSSTLDEVVIAVNRTAERKINVAQQVNVITAATISQRQPMTTADLLHDSGQLFVQRSQQGGGSPVIRGYEASRILLVVDGVRMNNLIYRSGHLQNVITMDPNVIDRVEILSGPGSTVYGSDALGGVVHFMTRKPALNPDGGWKLSGGASAGYQSANNGLRLHASLNAGSRKFASLTAFTASDFGDLKMGAAANPFYKESYYGERPYYQDRINGRDSLVSNPNKLVQKYSGYSQLDIMQKILYSPSDNWQHSLNVQYSTSSDIPRYDRLTDPKGSGLNSAEWYYGPQNRFLSVYSLTRFSEGFFSRYDMSASFQKVQESRHNRGFGSVKLNHRNEDVTVAGWQMSARREGARHDLRTGVEVYWNGLKSTAYQENIETMQTVSLDTRYPDGKNSVFNASVYATHTWRISRQLTLNDGVRLGFNSLSSTFGNKTFFPFPFDKVTQNNPVYSGSLGLIFKEKNLRASVLTSMGFRTPNIDDLAKVFESAPGRLIIPNPSLRPEATWSKEANLGYFSKKWSLENVVYHSSLFDFIALAPGSLNGNDYVLYNDSLSRIYTSVNQARGFIMGYNGQLTGNFGKYQAQAGFSYTYGRNKTETGTAPLDHIPPMVVRVGLNYNSDKIDGGFFILANGSKKKADYSSSGEDNAQYAPPDGMPAWMTLNIRGAWRIKETIKILAGIDNILDTQHRYFASGINAPGRNLWTSISVSW